MLMTFGDDIALVFVIVVGGRLRQRQTVLPPYLDSIQPLFCWFAVLSYCFWFILVLNMYFPNNPL